MGHLAPYLCLFRDCSKAKIAFISEEEWLEHLQQRHLVPKWKCSLCTTDNAEFDEADFLQKHILENHSRSIHGLDMAYLVRSSRRNGMFSACLICGTSFNDESLSLSEVQQRAIVCMTNHLTTFALGCLPWHFESHYVTSDYAEGASTHGTLYLMLRSFQHIWMIYPRATKGRATHSSRSILKGLNRFRHLIRLNQS